MRHKIKKPRQIFFVCAGIDYQNNLQTKSIAAFSVEEADVIFTNEIGFKPKDILGPFYKKHIQHPIDLKKVMFSNIWKTAEYKGWNVSACILKEPINYAMILFKNRIDGSDTVKPQGNKLVVSIQDLRIIND